MCGGFCCCVCLPGALVHWHKFVWPAVAVAMRDTARAVYELQQTWLCVAVLSVWGGYCGCLCACRVRVGTVGCLCLLTWCTETLWGCVCVGYVCVGMCVCASGYTLGAEGSAIVAQAIKMCTKLTGLNLQGVRLGCWATVGTELWDVVAVSVPVRSM